MATARRSTIQRDNKLINANTTAGRSTTSSIGARPYSSANASTINTVPTVGKATTTSQVKNTAPSTVGKGGYVTAAPAKNVNSNTTAPKSSTPATPVMNTAPSVTPKASTSNPIPASTYNSDAVGKGGYITAAPDKNDINNYNTSAPLIDPESDAAKRLNSYYELANLVSGAGTNQAAANMTPAQRTELLGSVLGAAPYLANNTAGYDALLNVVNQGKTRNPNLSRYIGEDEVGKAEREFAERDYSNPNFPYQNYGFSDTRMIGPEYVGKGGAYEPGNLLDAVSDGDIRPYSTPNSDYDASSGLLNALLGGGGSDASASASASGGGSGSRTTNIYGGAGGDGYMDISALYDLLNQRLGEYDANYQSLLDSLNTNYADMLNALGLNYADTEALLNGQLTNSRNELEDARRRQLQEAYISRMMQEKGLADMLDAYGLTGGASESVMADMRNNYANNRNAVEERVQNSLRDLLMNYLTNVTNARQRYNDSLLNAQNSRVSALNDAANYRSQARANAYEDLYNTLANLTMKGINYGT